ncbi:MAG: FliH/SctL family protein [Phycisphaerae bacterium]
MAGVLRREKFSSGPAFSFEDLEGKARAILAEARAQARQIVDRAEEEGRRRAAALEQEGYPRGLEEGRRQGFQQAHAQAAEGALQEAREELAQLARALAEALDTFEESRRRLLATAECGLLELSLAIARRVCKHDVGASSAAARANAGALLEMVKHEGDLELHLNPAECEALRNALPELIASTGRLAHVEIVADPAVQRGGCLLHARDGTIDASLETQLDHVAAALVKKTGDGNCERVAEN